MNRLRTIWVALLTASMAFNGVTYEVEAEGESIWDGGEVIEIQKRLEIYSDPLAKGSKVSGTYDLSDPANVTSVVDTWDYAKEVFGIRGSFVGGASQENLITLTNATTSSGGAMDIFGLFRAPPDAIMSGASEGWFRIPTSIHPHQNVTLKFYHVENPKKFNIVESQKNYLYAYPEPTTQMNPTMVWSETYDWDAESGGNNFEDLSHLSYSGNWETFWRDHLDQAPPVDSNTVFSSTCDFNGVSLYISPWDNDCHHLFFPPIDIDEISPGDFQTLKDTGGLNGLTRIDTPDNSSTSEWFRTYLWWSFAWYPDEWYVYHVRYDSDDGDWTLEPSHEWNDFLPQTAPNETVIYTSTADIAYDDIYQSTIWTRGPGNGFDAPYIEWDLPIDLGASMIFTEGLGYGMRGDNLSRNGANLESEISPLRIPSCSGGYDGFYGTDSSSVYGIANEPSYVDKMINCIKYDAEPWDLWNSNGFQHCTSGILVDKQCIEYDTSEGDLSITAGFDYAHFGNNFYNGQSSSTGINNLGLDGFPNDLNPLIVNQGVEPSMGGSTWQTTAPANAPAPYLSGGFLDLEDNVHLECGDDSLGPSPTWSEWVQDGTLTIPAYCNWNFNPYFGCDTYPGTEGECVQEPSIHLGADKSSALYDEITQITISGTFRPEWEEASDFPGGTSSGGGETDYVTSLGNMYLAGTEDWEDLGEAANDRFGSSIGGQCDVNGDGYSDVIVGAGGNDGAGNSAGEVYVYHGSATGPSATPDWSTEGENANDLYGEAMTLHSLTIGHSVACAGDVDGDGYDEIIVGAPKNDDGASNAGKVYVYYGSSSGLTANTWTYEGTAVEAWVGISVAGGGDFNADGYDDIAIGCSCNYVYAFYGSATGLAATPDWSEENPSGIPGQSFGYSLAIGDLVSNYWNLYTVSTDDLVIGAPTWETGSDFDRGKVYVYEGTTSGLMVQALTTRVGEYDEDYFGFSVAAGDITGDGMVFECNPYPNQCDFQYNRREELIVGAPGFGANDQGKVYVYKNANPGNSGAGSYVATNPFWTASGENGDFFGSSVAAVPFLFGTNAPGILQWTGESCTACGYAALLVGAQGFDGQFSNTGKVFLYVGGDPAIIGTEAVGQDPATPHWIDVGVYADDDLGMAVASAGDTDGDGAEDILLGGLRGQEGNARVFFGAPGPSELFIDPARLNKCDAYNQTGQAATFDDGATCPVLSQYTATICTNVYCYTTQEPIGWRIYVYHSTGSGTHPVWDCNDCIIAEFGNAATNQYVSTYIGDIGEGTCERYICEDEWYFYAATFRSFPDATAGAGEALPLKGAEAEVCMGQLTTNYALDLICSHEGQTQAGCIGDCRPEGSEIMTNSNLVALGGQQNAYDTVYWNGPGMASFIGAAPQYGGHFFGGFTNNMIYNQFFSFRDAETMYEGMENEGLESNIFEIHDDTGAPKAMRDIPMFIHDGIVFFDKFKEPFDASKDRMTFTMPFMKSGVPYVRTGDGDSIQVNDTLMMVMAIGLDADFNMLNANSWTACSQLVNDHIICSGRDTDIDTGYYGPNAASNAWGMAYVGDNSYDDFYDYRPVTVIGDGLVGEDASCNGDVCLDGATYVKFIVGWNHILPYTPLERDTSNANNYGDHPQDKNYDDNQLQSFYMSNGFEMPVTDISYWLHDKYGNFPDTADADYMFLNSVYYIEGWADSALCNERTGWSEYVDETYCTGVYQSGVFEIFKEHKGSYNGYDLNTMMPNFDLWQPYRTDPASPDEYWLEQPLYRTTGCATAICPSGVGWIHEKHRNLRPFHTFNTGSGTWSNLNPVQYINQFEFNVVLTLDNVTYENAEFWEIYPNFIQEVEGGTIVIDDVAFKGTGYSFDWTVASGINGANQFKELYIWLENNKRQQISEGSVTEVAGQTMKDATVDWKARLLNGIVELYEWFTAALFALVTFIVSRLQTVVSTIIDIVLFIIPFSIFALGFTICVAWMKISIAAIRGEWEVVQQLLNAGPLGIKAAFINVNDLREYA